MKTVHNQTASNAAKPRMNYQPDRHYVRAEIQHNGFDGDAVDRLLDTIDPETNEPAYRIEADPSSAEGRKMSGDRRLMILSCSQEYADRMTRSSADQSSANAREPEPLGENEFEKFGESGKTIEMKLRASGLSPT